MGLADFRWRHSAWKVEPPPDALLSTSPASGRGEGLDVERLQRRQTVEGHRSVGCSIGSGALAGTWCRSQAQHRSAYGSRS